MDGRQLHSFKFPFFLRKNAPVITATGRHPAPGHGLSVYDQQHVDYTTMHLFVFI